MIYYRFEHDNNWVIVHFDAFIVICLLLCSLSLLRELNKTKDILLISYLPGHRTMSIEKAI